MTREKLYQWALLRIARGDELENGDLAAAGFVLPPDGPQAARIADAAIRMDESVVTERLPAGLTREMIEGSP